MRHSKHWSLDDVPWERFDASRVEVNLLAIVKAASLVERNADDYVAYLCDVFADDPTFQALIRQWGEEELQHGEALGRWAEMADPQFCFRRTFNEFRARYRIPPAAGGSVRGSRAGEMVARCVVESGTSSLYSALRDGTNEPVLKFICGKIAADEFRHYSLFYRHLLTCADYGRTGLLGRAKIALRRFDETTDDELAIAFHCANLAEQPYEHETSFRAYSTRVWQYYRAHHLQRAIRMILKAVGFDPNGWVHRLTSHLAWSHLHRRWRAHV